MSLTANIDPTENAFTGNPVYLSVETTSMATYNIMYFVNFEFMRSIFTGNGNGSFKVNIAEVLETLFVLAEGRQQRFRRAARHRHPGAQLGLLGVAQIGEGVLQRDVLDAVEQIGRRAEIRRVVARGNIILHRLQNPDGLSRGVVGAAQHRPAKRAARVGAENSRCTVQPQRRGHHCAEAAVLVIDHE